MFSGLSRLIRGGEADLRETAIPGAMDPKETTTGRIKEREAIPERYSGDVLHFEAAPAVPREIVEEDPTRRYDVSDFFNQFKTAFERLREVKPERGNEMTDRYTLLSDKAEALERAYYKDAKTLSGSFERFARAVADLEDEIKIQRREFTKQAKEGARNAEERRRAIIDALGGLLAARQINGEDMRVVNDALEQRVGSDNIYVPQVIQRTESLLATAKALVKQVRPEVEELVQRQEAQISPERRLQTLRVQRETILRRISELQSPARSVVVRSEDTHSRASGPHEKVFSSYLRELGSLVQALEQLTGMIAKAEAQVGQVKAPDETALPRRSKRQGKTEPVDARINAA